MSGVGGRRIVKRRSCYNNCAVFIFRKARRTEPSLRWPVPRSRLSLGIPKSFSHQRVIKAATVIPPLVRSEAVIPGR
jgi:hypothetical protein